jgi:predicted nucleic acid-binding Zn ribbon protein
VTQCGQSDDVMMDMKPQPQSTQEALAGVVERV